VEDSLNPNFKPNLAATLTEGKPLIYPGYDSPKIDGIRATVFEGVAYSRSLKPIPNEHFQRWVRNGASYLQGMDGEITIGGATHPNCMQNSMKIMKKDGEPDFVFNVFDWVPEHKLDAYQFEDRMEFVHTNCVGRNPQLVVVPQHATFGEGWTQGLETQFLEQGYEGLMHRSAEGLYKFGRSTVKEGGLVKVKRFSDAEAIIVGYEEEMHNANDKAVNELGQLRPSSHAVGLKGKGTLGSFLVRNFENDPCGEVGPVFKVGTGYTADQRRAFWIDREDYIGELLTYKFFDHGIVEAPRHPVFKAIRHHEDT
jgi:DNA ligase-1